MKVAARRKWSNSGSGWVKLWRGSCGGADKKRDPTSVYASKRKIFPPHITKTNMTTYHFPSLLCRHQTAFQRQFGTTFDDTNSPSIKAEFANHCRLARSCGPVLLDWLEVARKNLMVQTTIWSEYISLPAKIQVRWMGDRLKYALSVYIYCLQRQSNST